MDLRELNKNVVIDRYLKIKRREGEIFYLVQQTGPPENAEKEKGVCCSKMEKGQKKGG